MSDITVELGYMYESIVMKDAYLLSVNFNNIYYKDMTELITNPRDTDREVYFKFLK